MKSLEIVNRERDKLKANIDLGVIQKRSVELQNIDIAKLKELEQIKQDLEVLEILRLIFKKSTHYVIKGDLETFYSITIEDEVGDNVDFNFRKPEYNKIVKWLEENE